jgi:hypothetical protein
MLAGVARARRSTLLSLAAGVLLGSPALAVETFGKDVGATRELADAHGHRFAVTFRPPRGHALDPRILDAFQISVSSNTGGADRKSGAADVQLLAGSDGDEIDVSGYTIQVEAVSLAGCTSEVRIARSTPGILTKLDRVTFMASGASSMTIVAFPTSGDVNVDISVSNRERCASSGKPEGSLDVAVCALPGCNAINGTEYLEGAITNPRNEDVRYVGAATIVFVN